MSPDVEAELHSHCQALRSLARALVGEQHADDLVQDTALQALRQPEPPRSLRAWLVTVLHFLAHKHRRSDRRRGRRERLAARPEALPPADREIEQGDTLRRLVEQVLALPQPYREVVLLRYLREMSPGQIAAATGVPLATVKSQLQRGLMLLRERLEQRGGDWRAGLCLLFGIERALPVAAAAAITTTGVLLMGSGVKLAITAAAAVLAVGAGWWCVRGEEPAAPPAAVGAAEQPSPVAAAVPGAAMPSQGSEAAANRRTEMPAADSPIASPLATLLGRCIDADGRPVGDAIVTLREAASAAWQRDLWLQTHTEPPATRLRTTTSADGRFELSYAPTTAASFDLYVDRADLVGVRGHWDKLGPGTTDLGDVVLLHGAVIRGRVHEIDDSPIARWQLSMQRAGTDAAVLRPLPYTLCQTEADGSFRTDLTPPGVYEFQIGDREVQSPKRLVVDPGAHFVDVDIVLRPRTVVADAVLRGIVVDAGGEPMAQTRVGPFPDHYSGRWTTATTDDGGRFELRCRKDQTAREVSLLFEKEGFELLRFDTAPDCERELSICLQRCPDVQLQVLADDGSPVEDYHVYLFPKPRTRGFQRSVDYRARANGHHPQGRALVPGILRGPQCLLVAPEDERFCASGLQQFEVGDDSPVQVVVRLPRAATQPVRVQFADGAPAANADLGLFDPLGGELYEASLPYAPARTAAEFQDGPLLRQRATTDARGEAKLRGPADTELVLLLRGPGFVPMVQRGIRLGQAATLQLTVAAGARVVGSVRPLSAVPQLRLAAGLPASGPFDPARAPRAPSIRLLGDVANGWSLQSRSNAAPVAIAADGTFAIEHVPAGAWQVAVTWSQVAGQDQVPAQTTAVLASITVSDGELRRLDLDLSPVVPGRLEGTVLRGDQPVAFARLRLTNDLGNDAQGQPWQFDVFVDTDAAGHFRSLCRPASYGIELLQVGDDPREADLPAAEHAEVLPGQTVTQPFHIRSGVLRLHVLGLDGSDATSLRLALRPMRQPDYRYLPVTDGQGVTTGVRAPGDYTVLVLPSSLQSDDARTAFYRSHRETRDPLAAVWIELGSVTIDQDRATEVELRLPPAWDH